MKKKNKAKPLKCWEVRENITLGNKRTKIDEIVEELYLIAKDNADGARTVMIEFKEEAKALLELHIPRWIDIKDFVPKSSGRYLCAVKNSNYIDFYNYYAEYACFCDTSITHWMAAPQKPEEE